MTTWAKWLIGPRRPKVFTVAVLAAPELRGGLGLLHVLSSWIEGARVVGPQGCWIWTGAPLSSGYGRFRGQRAHRYSWVLAYGPIPEGLNVCHSCDVKLCVRPSHLFLGTYADNHRDCEKKGRHAHGETHGKARLTVKDVRLIRQNPTLRTQEAWANLFGVRQAAISKVILRRTWRGVD